jgi:parallel beta-helix repeat protein
LVVSVKDTGAKGDGNTNDTAAIQAAIDMVTGTGGTVLVPDGTYLIQLDFVPFAGNYGLELKSDMTFKMAPNAILKAIPLDSSDYGLIRVFDSHDLNVVGGTLVGDRGSFPNRGGEWGMGLAIHGSSNVNIEGVTSKDFWGDGFYVAGGDPALGDLPAKSVTFCNVTADNNRRQGLSIINADGIVVRDSVFKNTNGTLPECGIDIEPEPGDTVTNARISGSTFDKNASCGLQIGPATVNITTAFVTKTVVEKNTFSNNGVGGLASERYGIELSACTGNILRNNQVTDNTGIGIGVLGTTDASVTGNTVTGTKLGMGSPNESGAGIILEDDHGTLCADNTVTGNAGHGIFQWQSDATLMSNKVSGNGLVP